MSLLRKLIDLECSRHGWASLAIFVEIISGTLDL